MNRQEVLSIYKNQEDKILVAQILDKIKFVETRNKIQFTNFLDLRQISVVENFINKIKLSNCIWWGGYEEAERKVLIIYPEKFDLKMIEKNYNNIFKIVRIELPEEEKETLTHRNYLGGIMKLGVKREKIGDIIVGDNGADIIVIEDISEFLVKELTSLTRFSNGKIEEKNISDLKKNEVKKEEIKIIVSSLRLDNVISDLVRTSRAKAVDVINSERVFINGECQTKVSKEVKIGDKITVRGKGRFEVKNFAGKTRNGRVIVIIEKFV